MADAIPLNDSQVSGCTGRFDPDAHGFCRCCSASDEIDCRCDDDTRDPNLALAVSPPAGHDGDEEVR